MRSNCQNSNKSSDWPTGNTWHYAAVFCCGCFLGLDLISFSGGTVLEIVWNLWNNAQNTDGLNIKCIIAIRRQCLYRRRRTKSVPAFFHWNNTKYTFYGLSKTKKQNLIGWVSRVTYIQPIGQKPQAVCVGITGCRRRKGPLTVVYTNLLKKCGL